MVELSQYLLNESAPLISVIVPTYNKAPYLAEMINSVVAQSYPNLEIVLVDDGSTDNTKEVVSDISGKGLPIQLQFFSIPNGGVSAARNYGVGKAKGRLLLCIDADDWMDPNFAKDALQMMRSENCNLVYCGLVEFGLREGEWEPPQYDPYFVRFNNCIPTLVLFDRVLWDAVGGWDTAYPFNEDWQFYVAASKYGLNARKLNGKHLHYRITDQGLAMTYIRDTWPYSVSMIMTTCQDLYPVSSVLWGHDQLRTMPDRWYQRFVKQDTLYPNRMALNIWMGLYEEAHGNFDKALNYYSAAARVVGASEWQPLFLIGRLIESADQNGARALYHRARTIRPDLNQFVEDKLR